MLNRLSFVISSSKGALVYEQLGYKAFGMPGKLAASCSITMQNIGGESQRCFNSIEKVFVLCAIIELRPTWIPQAGTLVLCV